MKLSVSQQENQNATPDDFQCHIRVFPLDFEGNLFKYYFIYVFAIFVFGLTLDGIIDVHYQTPFGKSEILAKLTDWVGLLWMAGIPIAALLIYKLGRKVDNIFDFLHSKLKIGESSQQDTIHQKYKQFLDEYQQTLSSKKRYILIGSILVAGFISNLIVILPIVTYYDSLYQVDPFETIIIWFLIIQGNVLPASLWAYSAGVAAWAMCVTGLKLRKLTSEFDFTIQPSHPDNSGGLKPLGTFCLDMALPILLCAILLGVYGIGNVLHRATAFMITANLFLFLFVMPLAAITFFVPLWNVHRKMVAKRVAYDNEFADRIALTEKRMRVSLDKGALEEAKAAKEEMEVVQALHPDKISYPTWPFDRNILLRFLTPQIVPLLSLIVGLSNPVAEALKGALSIFSGR